MSTMNSRTLAGGHWRVSVALSALLLLGVVDCDLAAAIELTSSPVLELQANAPLTGLLDLATDVPTSVSFRVRGPGESWIVQSTEYSMDHSIPVLGLAADRQYTVDRLKLSSQGGMSLHVPDALPIATGSLPGTFPDFIVRTSKPAQMERGLTMFGTAGYTMAVDSQGVARWYVPFQGDDVRLQSNGLLVSRVGVDIQEFDFLGQVHRGWYPTNRAPPSFPASLPVTANIFHHDVFPMPNGNYVTLTREETTFDDYPTSDSDPNAPTGTKDVRHDIVLEFAPDGTTVHSWDLIDILDPRRLGYGSTNSSVVDWSHANAVIYDSADDTFIVSVRHQDAVIKISRSTGELKWILGPHENWGPEFQQYLLTPVGDDFRWSYHQHAPMLLPNGDLLLHDNGNFRASPFDTLILDRDNFSRSVEYAIDEENMEITQVWQYGQGADEIIYTRSRGDSDWMSETDNILTTFTHALYFDHVLQDPIGTRIIETARSGEVVFDLQLSRPTTSTFAYRSERIHSLYGAGFFVTAVPEPATYVAMLVSCTSLVFLRRRRYKQR